jgi:hypothetical protein
MTLPKTLEEAIEQAKISTQAAIDDSYKRLQVELVFPELKMMPIAAQFLEPFESLGNKLRVYFTDAGAAALARRDWGEKPFAIRGLSDLKSDIQPDEELLLFVEPSSVEVNGVEQLCQQAGDRAVVLLNPRMEDIVTIGIGYAGRQLRERFLKQFDTAYYLQPIEGAAILRAYPSPWQVWVEKGEDDYELAGEFSQKPNSEMLEGILIGTPHAESKEGAAEQPVQTRSPQRKGILSSLQQFLRALSQ